ncbi:MAG: hypothetical protein ACYS3N_17360 [Planctomycetota bacterium]
MKHNKAYVGTEAIPRQDGAKHEEYKHCRPILHEYPGSCLVCL